ncbi:hypothetical protein COV24_01975 [candidate division WWE3 bacterium CG10_big_fil_rev_8_21_14_0_10_32_10]|uniref:Glycosyltransferase RgtA/B/C/D-like domain-containing protein n=1 Tax=candidate division WWE3 bacterium CG10_big_fil_rev_8_21_14_0_10_32_10 TaxID=1975090 RepID=A0A2H0RAT6_UNCKA|nr:MAG: hypothetical protein COV24_01975 [candidate division WWE3 bacterium CG10_big_fil_rev_8_21_14_0_10_32_10]
MKKIIILFKQNYLFFITGAFILFGIFVRYKGLGYSDLQGDEINPLDYLGNIKGTNPTLTDFIAYLLVQKRGPIQYLINYANTSLFGYHNEYQVRLPFFILGSLALVSFYYFAKKIFDKNAAMWTTVFLALNGLYITFARITQYQSFMYFMVPVSLFVFVKAFKDRNYKLISISGFLLSLDMLGHYDTLSVLPFICFFVLASLYRDKSDFMYILKSGTLFSLFFIIPSILFYVPFLQNSSYESTTSDYLGRRIFGGGFMPRTPYVVEKILAMYVPMEGWAFLFLFIVLGLFFLGSNIRENKIFKYKIPFNLSYLYYFGVSLFSFGIIFSFFPLKPRLSTLIVYVGSILIILLLFLSKKVKPVYVGLASWFLFANAFYFFFLRDPRTHVYVVFIPGFILAGYGLSKFLNYFNSYIKIFFSTLIIIFFIYLSYINWIIYVDKNPEYLWWDKPVFWSNLYTLQHVRHKKIDGVFGFNHNRDWKIIRDYYDSGCLKGTYNSNEKNSITKFYMGVDQDNLLTDGMQLGADTLIGVEAPHSWYFYNMELYKSGYYLLKTIYKGNYEAVWIWGKVEVYPNGKLLCE